MQKAIEIERELGEDRVVTVGKEGEAQKGYDGMSDRWYTKHMSGSRLWGVEERKGLQGKKWEGLGSGVVRPVGEELGSNIGVDVRGTRLPFEKKKKGWFGGW